MAGAEEPRGAVGARGTAEGAELVVACSALAASMSASRVGISSRGSSAAWRRHCTAALTKQVVLSAPRRASELLVLLSVHVCGVMVPVGA